LPHREQQLLLALVLDQLAQRQPAAQRYVIELCLGMHCGGGGAGGEGENRADAYEQANWATEQSQFSFPLYRSLPM
jgi:hypothetical protein